MESDELEKAKFYLDEAHAEFDLTNEIRRKIDDKTYNMIALSGVLVNVIFGLTYFLIEQEITIAPLTLILLLSSISSYFVATFTGIQNYLPAPIQSRDIRKVIKKYEKGEEEYEPISPIQHVTWNLLRDAEKNQEINALKATRLRRMLFGFTIGTFILPLTLISLLLM